MPSDAVVIPQGLVGPGGADLCETDLFRPVYRPMQGDRWRLDVTPMYYSTGCRQALHDA
jgi:hypothetical protein